MAAELLHVDSGHQASPVFTIILAHTLLVQLICFIKAASACILEGLHTDVYHLYTKSFTLVKTNSCLLSHTLLHSLHQTLSMIRRIIYTLLESTHYQLQFSKVPGGTHLVKSDPCQAKSNLSCQLFISCNFLDWNLCQECVNLPRGSCCCQMQYKINILVIKCY